MTREEAINFLQIIREDYPLCESEKKSIKMAIQALSQEPCDLLIIKSDILMHQDERRKWMESIKQEKESGVIILPPYFEPLLVPNDIEINMEQEPCDDVVSREAVLTIASMHTLTIDETVKAIKNLPSVTQKSGKWDVSCTCSVCGKWRILESEKNGGKYKYCPNCGSAMKGE